MHQPEPVSEQQSLLDDNAFADNDDALPRPPTSPTTEPVCMPSAVRFSSKDSWMKKNQWVMLALGSGACAAFNAVFAKLTTTSSTSHLAERLGALLGLAPAGEPALVFEVVLRGFFFALNLGFDAVMWTIFTQALACAASTSQVTVINTSANFLLSGLLGLLVFAEALPLQWWAGATLLVAGTFVVGRAGEVDKAKAQHTAAAATAAVAAPIPVSPAAPTTAAGLAAAYTDVDADEDVADLASVDSILLVEPIPRGNSACGRRSPRLAKREVNKAD